MQHIGGPAVGWRGALAVYRRDRLGAVGGFVTYRRARHMLEGCTCSVQGGPLWSCRRVLQHMGRPVKGYAGALEMYRRDSS